MIMLHREIMGLKTGDPRVVDHCNGNTLDNRRANLRVISASENNQNRPNGVYRRRNKAGIKSRTSRHRGVVYDPRYRMPWKVTMYFPTEVEAAEAAEAWRKCYMPYADPNYRG